MKFCVVVTAFSLIFADASPLDAPLKVHLERVSARGGSTATFYVGKLAIGQPAQEFKVLFDTSSGHVLVPHKACKSLACREHKRYSPWASTFAMDVNVNGTEVDKGHRFARHGLIRDGVSVEFTQADLGEGEAKSSFCATWTHPRRCLRRIYSSGSWRG